MRLAKYLVALSLLHAALALASPVTAVYGPDWDGAVLLAQNQAPPPEREARTAPPGPGKRPGPGDRKGVV